MKYGQKLKLGDAHVTPRNIQEVQASSLGMPDGAVWIQMTDQLGTPREGMMSTTTSLPLVVKPKYIELVGERTKLKKVMLASFVTLRTMAPEILLVCLHPAAM
jgi:hypothetical protein